MPLESPPSILIGCKPHFVSCSFTEDFGPISIRGNGCVRNADSRGGGGGDVISSKIEKSKHNVYSMSLLSVQSLASAFDSISSGGRDSIVDTSPYEIPIFGRDESDTSHSSVRCNPNEQQQELLDTVSQMKGLPERLLDASKINQDEDNGRGRGGEIKKFLQTSDEIVKEFLSAVYQQRQMMTRNGNINGNGAKRKRADVSKSSFLEFPLIYFDALNSQCKEVDQIFNLIDNDNDGDGDGDESRGTIDLNQELTQITITYIDKSSRSHELIGDLPESFPMHGPNWVCDLPHPFEPKWRRYAHGGNKSNSETNGGITQSGLSSVVKEFIDLISSYQILWDDLDDIDKSAWILEPSLPARRSCTERRLALASGVSVHFEIDPDNSRSVPLTMRFIGSSKSLIEYRSSYQAYISLEQNLDILNDSHNSNDDKHGRPLLWSESLSIRQNLERCFGFQLPSPATTEKTDYLIECGICYAHRIAEAPSDGDDEGDSPKTIIPTIPCTNANCGRSYHESCLSEWLHSIPGAKVSFGRIFGQCPYCCDTISVKMYSE